jgi:hypothetical protein
MALDCAPALGFEIFILSAPTPFDRSEAEELQRSAAGVIARHFPDAPTLYARRGWQLPRRIGRVYDASRIERLTGFRCATDFGYVLDALRTDRKLPFIHKRLPIAERNPGHISNALRPGWVSPENLQSSERRTASM